MNVVSDSDGDSAEPDPQGAAAILLNRSRTQLLEEQMLNEHDSSEEASSDTEQRRFVNDSLRTSNEPIMPGAVEEVQQVRMKPVLRRTPTVGKLGALKKIPRKSYNSNLSQDIGPGDMELLDVNYLSKAQELALEIIARAESRSKEEAATTENTRDLPISTGSSEEFKQKAREIVASLKPRLGLALAELAVCSSCSFAHVINLVMLSSAFIQCLDLLM